MNCELIIMDSTPVVPTVQTFKPTWEEFSTKTVEEYVTYMESKGAHLAGISKVNI